VGPTIPAGPAASAHLLLRHRRAFYPAHSAAPPVNISTTHRAAETIDDSIRVSFTLFLIFPSGHHINIDTLTHAKPDSSSDIWRQRCSFQLLFPQPAPDAFPFLPDLC
jgi:hypothetical protein